MSIARFSPFELLLLKSRSQVDTATLLLLGWVLVHRQHVSEGQRRRRLAQVTSQFRHGHELGPVMSIAHSQDLHAIQLAAEVVRKECSKERSLSVMHQAITVATDDGDISLANHYILRFLADLLNVTPTTLGTLFQELTGQPLRQPEDPSRDAYWQAHDPDYYARKAREEAEAAQRAKASQAEQEQQQRAKADKQQEKKQQKEDARRAKARAEQSSAEQARAEQARQEQARQERARQEQARQEESRRRQQRSSPPPPDRTTRALAVLGLTPGASKTDVRRAYRRMAQLHHPDRFYSESEHQVALASARFQRIKNAYDYLMQTY
ncbi:MULTISPECIES: DnaJ domain-containing protein [unclassified Halomonas]|uniref:DnaJ domain-containing protein n=1 Tax=unclassified Halomonas TaxID=2609666 RepID=UPI001EF40E2E|nr:MULTISPECIES: DnaJ domain-containing protein [unclassified Halomonas]MCG7577025.1 DnaJ domain-containing protein [Halomonas sp. MMH1-48]MCG7589353.1 DnaJ domain-containing protein [Halomonas sp. McD50-5]MCG7604163.1 DnaJ domain-containing protein [Halomonas sp. MM17-34]MCG7613413.1 DnaJ domain-containing protein [Halomonas sp. MM17-29]MCG7615514.1 DnaJ domain-containing protein [Halomonas sp. McD50-4]